MTHQTAPTESPVPAVSSYPVMLDMRGRRCLVVGGGCVGRRKIAGLLEAGATVTVVAPRIDPQLLAIAGALVIARRRYRTRDLDGAHLVITCTDDAAVNRRVYEEATERGIWVNSADDPDNCTFTLPSVTRAGELTVAVSTNGKSPALSKWLRQRFEREFDGSWTELLDVLAAVRAEARSTLGTSELPGWEAALDDALLELVREGRTADAAAVVRQHLGLAVAA